MRLTSWLSAVRSFGYRARPQGQFQKRTIRRNLDWLERLEDRTLLAVNLSVDTNTATEAGATVVTVTATNNSGAVSGAQTVDLSVTGTGITGSDYSLSNTTITIPNGMTSGSVTFTVLNDNLVELTETATLTISNPSGGIVLGGTTSQNVAITDNDSAVISISSPSIGEGANLAFSVTIDNPVDVTVNANRATADGTATTGDSDYVAIASSGVTLFAANSTTAFTINVGTGNDSKVELNETLSVILSSLSAGGRSVTFSGGGPTLTGTGTITNNDTASLSINDITPFENGTFTFTIASNVLASQDMTVVVNTADGTATLAGSDYTQITNQTATITAGSLTTFVTVTVNDDSIVEFAETFTVGLSNAQFNGATDASRVVIGDNSGTATIQNNDAASLTINDISVAENGVFTFTITSDRVASQNLTVLVSTGNGTATLAGSDYTQITSQLATITAGSLTTTVTVTVNDDSIVENDETFTVGLSNALFGGFSNSSFVVIGDPSGTGTITNNDSAVFNVSDQTQNEGLGLTFTITLTNPVDVATSVTFTTSDGTAQTGDSDYTGISGQVVNFAANQVSQTVTVNTGTDNKVEANETFTVTLGGLNNGGRPTVTIGDGTGTGTITNEDSAVFNVSDQTQNEGTGLTFTITLTNPVDVATSVTFTTSDGTALTGDSDYTAISGQVVNFAANQVSQTVTVNTGNDNKVEPNETFTVTLGGLNNGGRPTVTIGDGTGTGTITNNDTASISIADLTQNENGTFTFTITSTNPSSQNLTGTINTADGSATLAGSDYTQISGGTFTILGNGSATTTTVTVVVNNDTLVEGTENFNVNLTSPLFGGAVDASRVIIGDGNAVGTITDNESAVITFTNPSFNVSEGDTSTTFNVTLTITANSVVNSGTLDRPVTFQVSNTNTGTATTVGPPVDYTFSTQSYSYPIGTASNSTQTVTMGINEDISTESSETVILQFSSLSDGTGGRVTTGGNETITILDNDAGTDPVFNAPTNNGTDVFRVVRSGANVLFYRNTVLIDTRSLGSMTSLTIQGANAETDTLDVDLTLGNVIPANGINFYGGSGANNDAMTITGGAQGDVIYNYTNAHDGSVVMSLFGTVNYTGLEPLTNTGTAANATFNLPNGGNIATLSASGGGLQLSSAPVTFEVTTFTLPTVSLTINGGTGTDDLTISSVNGGVFALSVLFGAGADVITQNASMTLGSGASTGNVNYTAGTINVNQQITNTAGTVGTVTMNASGTLTIAAAANISADGTVSLTGSTLISTAGDITTTDDAVTFNSNTTLTDDISIDTGAGVGTITFSGTLNGTTTGAEDLSLTAGTGSVVFTGAVGGTVALNDVTIASALNVTVSSTIRTAGDVTQTAGTGTTTFNGTSGTGIGGTLDVTTDAITFNTATFTTVGTVSLDAQNAINVNAGIDSGASTITILANQNGLGGQSFTMGGTGALTTTNSTSTAVSITVNTAGGGTGDASLRGITTGASGRVTITTNSGDITDNNAAATNITALEALLLAALAGGAIGTTGNSLETAVTRLEAQANTGGVFVDNTSASLTIGGISGTVGVSATGSDIVVTTSGGVLIVSENVTNTSGTGTDDVTLTAKDSAGAGHNLTVNASTTVSAAAGDVTLDAGDVLTLTNSTTSVVQATGTNGDVNLISDVTAADAIGSQALNGIITANGTNGIVTINLGTGTGDAVQTAGTITGNALRLLSATNGGRFNLSASTTNNVDEFAANSSGTITYVNQDDLTITTVSTTTGLSTSDDDVRLVITAGEFSILETINLNDGGAGGAGGSLDLVATTGATQAGTANILANHLLLRGSNLTINTNVFDLDNTTNNVDTIAADLTNGAVYYSDRDNLTVGTASVTTLGTVPNSSAIGITVGNAGNVAPNGGDVILRAGQVTLTGLLMVTEIIDTTTGTLGDLTIGNGVQFIGSGNTDVGSGDIDLAGGSGVPDIIIDNATTHTMTGGTVTYRPHRDIFINQPVTVENGNFILDADGETALVNTTIAQTTSILDVNRNLGTGNGVGGVWIRSAGSIDVNFGALSAGALIIAGSQINNAPAYGGLVGGAGVQIDNTTGGTDVSASSTISMLVKTITGAGSALNDMQISGQVVGDAGSAINVQVEDTLTLTGTIALSTEGNITIDAQDMVIGGAAVINAVETGASTTTGIVWLRNRGVDREIDLGGAALPAMPGGRLSLTNAELNRISLAQVVRIGRNGNSGVTTTVGAGLMTISVPDLDLSQNTVLHLITSDEIVDGGAGGINGLGTIIEDDVALEADDGIDLHNFDATATTGNDVDHLAILVTGGDAVFKDRDEVIFQIVDFTAAVAVDAVQVSGDLTMIMGGDLTQIDAVNVGGLELIDLFNGAATNPQSFLESPFYFLPHSSNQIDNLEAYSLNQVNVTNSTTLSVNTVANSYLTFPVGGSSGIWVQRLLLKAPTIITLLPIETNDEIGTVTFDVTTLLDINANIFARSTIEQIGTGGVSIDDVELRTTDDTISFLGGVTLDGASATTPTTMSTDAGWTSPFSGITLAAAAPAQTGGGSIVFSSTLRSSPSGDTAAAFRGNDIWLETGLGNIQFIGQVGGTGTNPANGAVSGRVGVINIIDAHDVTASTGLSANAFYQQTGDGETRFNGLVQTNGRANFVATTPLAAGNYGVDITTKMITLNAGMTTTQGVAGVAAAIRLNNSGTLSIIAGTGSISSQGAVTQVGTGDNLVGGNIITSNDDISFASDTYLSGTPLQFTAGTANVSFAKRFQINNKTITIREEGTLNVGTVTAIAGGTLNVITDSTGLAGTLEIGLNELLTGTGIINAAVTVLGSVASGAGTIAPAQDASGLGTGILTINGATSFGQNAVLAADLNGTVAGSSYDQLKVNGTLALGTTAIFAGTRPVTFNPALSTMLTVIDANTLTGKFSNATTVAPGNFLYINGLYFSYVYDASNNFVLTRQDAATPVSYIIDDNGNSTGALPPGFSITPNTTAAWSPNSVAGRGYGNDLRFSAASTNTATWTFTGLAAGNYRVSTTWFPHANRADNASFTINGGTAVPLNQRNAPNDFNSDGSAWEDISTSFNLAAPGSITVQLSAVGATGYVIADAVRVQPLTTSAPEIQVFDYTAPSTYIDVADGTGIIDFGTVDQGAGGGSISKTIRVYNTGSSPLLLSSASITVPAGFSVTGYNPQTIAAATSATLALNTSFITLTLTLNTATAANYNGQVSFNTNDFDENPFNFTVKAGVSSNTVKIADNLTAGSGYNTITGAANNAGTNRMYGEVGLWHNNDDSLVGYQQDLRYANANANSQATWTFSSLAIGTYRVSVTYRAEPNRASNASFSVAGTGATTVNTTINQRVAPNQFQDTNIYWIDLAGSFAISGGSITVTLDALGSNGFVIADAVRVEYLSAAYPELAAAGPAANPTSTVLNAADLNATAAAAVARWQQAGLTAAQQSALNGIVFTIADLPGAMLGAETGETIFIDSNAAGYGWYVDSTPQDDAEFRLTIASTELGATDPVAASQMDLLTVLMHEIGHRLGLDDVALIDDAHGLMAESLNVGTRRLPVVAAVSEGDVDDSGDASDVATDDVSDQLFYTLGAEDDSTPTAPILAVNGISGSSHEKNHGSGHSTGENQGANRHHRTGGKPHAVPAGNRSLLGTLLNLVRNRRK